MSFDRERRFWHPAKASRRRRAKGSRPGRDRYLYRRLYALAKPYRLHILGLLLLGLLASPIALLLPIPLKIAVDNVLQDHPIPGALDAVLPGSGAPSDGAVLGALVVMVLLLALASQVQAFGTWFLQSYLSERMTLEVQSDLFRHAQRLSLAYHDTTGTADSVFRIQYDAREIPNLVTGTTIPLITGFVRVASMLYVAALIDWQLSLVAIIVAPLLFFMLRAYKDRTHKQYRESKRLQSSAVSVVQETLGALRVVKAFGQEERERDRFVEHSRASVRARLRLVLAEAAFGSAVGMVTAAGTAAMLFLGVRHVQTGVIQLGELLVLMAYLKALYDPLQNMSRKVASLQSSFASADRAFALMDELTDVEERPEARELERARGHLTFRDVSFSYPGGRQVLERASFDVPPGSSVGIIGVTGAGKTTLVSLLMRFFDPTSGAIELDGVDHRDYRLADLRGQFAMVLQEPLLFSASIGENIAYARPDASLEEVEAAARAAGAHDFIQRLPDGYDTVVGERGMTLSGGERQRVSLARAFLKDAPILILDEPTSALDAMTEGIIIDAMQRLKAGRTTFVIAHRPSLLEGCDQLLSVESGRVELAVTTDHTTDEGRAGANGSGGVADVRRTS